MNDVDSHSSENLLEVHFYGIRKNKKEGRKEGRV
jgi:hypothetical protein